jgi:hypothetical protein
MIQRVSNEIDLLFERFSAVNIKVIFSTYSAQASLQLQAGCFEEIKMDMNPSLLRLFFQAMQLMLEWG